VTSAERSAVEAWLAPRLAQAPEELAGAVRRLLGEVVDARGGGLARGIPGDLAAAALRGFDGMIDDGETDQASRSAALRLLAADALLTYAFEAAADLGGDVLELAARAGVDGALGERLRRPGAGSRAAPSADAGGAS
jgi:hypothetical protein